MIQSNPALPFSEVAVVYTSDPKSGIYQGDSSLYEFDFFLVFSLLLLSEETFSHVLCWQVRATKRKERKRKRKNKLPTLICFAHAAIIWNLS